MTALVVASAGGCGDSNGGPGQVRTPSCVRASDCTGALACIQGFCVQQCVESKDCPSGQRCIPATGGNSCQPPERTVCAYTSECTIPLVCGLDQQCRAQCQSTVDCPKGQFCTTTSKLCADPTVDRNYDPMLNDFVSSVDAGGRDTAVVVAVDAGGPPDLNQVAPDAPIAGPEVQAVDAARDPGSADARPGDVPGAVPDSASVLSDVPLNFDGPALPVDGVVVTPSPSVRQGQINITMTVTRIGGGLLGAGGFDLGDLTTRAQPESTDTSLVLKVSVPHAAALGKRTLRFVTASGVVTAPGVVEVTAITAGPTGADSNAGSAVSPFLTLKQAILVADVGDTIHLLDGSYTAKGGETWSYVIPDNLTIVGDSTAGTIIDGVGATSNPNGLNASAGVTLKTLTLQHFNYGIEVSKPSSRLTLQDVVLGGNARAAIYVQQAATGSTVNVLGKGTLIDQPGQTGIYVYNAPNVTVNITDATVQGGSYVVYFAANCSGAKLNLAGATIKQLASYSAIYLALSSNTVGSTAIIDKSTIVGTISGNDSKGSLIISGSTIAQKSGNAIDFSGGVLGMIDTGITMTAANTAIYFSGTQATMSLKGVTITGGGYGIQQLGTGSSAKLRSTSISGTNYDAYQLSAGDLDLGTATESGDNVIGAPTSTSYWCLDIYRPQGASAGSPVTCSGTTLNGLAPSPGTIDASAGTVSLQPQRYNVTTGNKLIFY